MACNNSRCLTRKKKLGGAFAEVDGAMTLPAL